MIKNGSKVKFIDERKHTIHPEFYPEVGTIGEVVKITETVKDPVDGDYFVLSVQWPKNSTSRNDNFLCYSLDVEEVVEEAGSKEDNTFEVGDVVRIKKEWLEKYEDPLTDYIVLDWNPDNGHIRICTKSEKMYFPIVNDISDTMVYKVGHVDLEK